MSLKGSFATLPFSDLLGIIELGRKTGMLRCDTTPHVKKIFFENGAIVAAESTDPVERLGQFLRGRGMLSEKQLDYALGLHTKAGGLLGSILVLIGAIDRATLAQMLKEKTEEIVYSLISWEQASFEFFPHERSAPVPIRLQLRAADVVLEGTVRHDELKTIRAVFADDSVVLRRTAKPPTKAVLADPLGQRLLELIDGELSIEELRLKVHTSAFSVGKALLNLHREGCCERVSVTV